MLVPATTVPVTIIGAFAAMAIFGFSINLSTLFAIVLAVGIVVDDAIVVVERAAYLIARGLERREAAATALDELFGPIIGITLVLMAVFIPASFLAGLSGRLYAQFALVIAATAAISAVNAATLKPVQCATWLRPPRTGHRPALLFRLFDRAHGALERRYVGAAVLPGAARRHDHRRRAGARRREHLRLRPHPDQLPAARGPGLFPRHGPAPARRRARPHRAGAAARAGEGAHAGLRARSDRHRRRLAAGRQRLAVQQRRGLSHAEGLVAAARRRWRPALALRPDQRRDERYRGRPHAGDRPARDPRPGQCRRLHDDGRDARRQHRFRPAAIGDQQHRHRGRRRTRCCSASPRRSAPMRRRSASRSTG